MGNFSRFQKSEDYYIHPRLGQIKRIQEQDGPQMIEYKVLVESQDVFQEWGDIVQKLNKSICKDIIFLPKSYTFQKIGYCGHHGEAFLVFEDYMFSLKDEIKNRRIINRPFPEEFVWEILYKLIKVQNYLQSNKMMIGNVNSQNIIVNEQGDLRIISQYSSPGPQNNSLQLGESEIKLFPPEQWQEFKKIRAYIQKQQLLNSSENRACTLLNEQNQKYNKNIAEMFTIGMTLLEICTLEQSKQLYTQKGVSQPLLSNRINSLNNKYSSGLNNIIGQMLRIIPSQRIKLQEVLTLLAPHQQSILNHKKFELKYQISSVLFDRSIITSDSTRMSRQERRSWERLSNLFPCLPQISKTQKAMINNVPINRYIVMGKPNVILAAVY